jgi:hypothetical protein
MPFLSVGWHPWSISGWATGPIKSHDVLSTCTPKEADSLGFEGSSLSPIGIAFLRGAIRSVGW